MSTSPMCDLCLVGHPVYAVTCIECTARMIADLPRGHQDRLIDGYRILGPLLRERVDEINQRTDAAGSLSI